MLNFPLTNSTEKLSWQGLASSAVLIAILQTAVILALRSL